MRYAPMRLRLATMVRAKPERKNTKPAMARRMSLPVYAISPSFSMPTPFTNPFFEIGDSAINGSAGGSALDGDAAAEVWGDTGAAGLVAGAVGEGLLGVAAATCCSGGIT